MAHRTDGNQKAIVEALRAAGASVLLLHEVGKGCPDLLVGYVDHQTGIPTNALIEIKDPAQEPRKRRLRPVQQQWHADWRGQVAVVLTEDDALRIIGAI